MFDLGPAADQMSRLVRGVRPDQLDAATPCPDYTLGDLLDHVRGLSLVFALAARKESSLTGSGGPSGDVSRLPDDWPDSTVALLDGLAEAWRAEEAWSGRVTVAGVDSTAEETALVALEELTVHAWDVARATGQTYEPDSGSLAGVERFASVFLGEGGGNGGFGPPVRVPDDAPYVDRVLALTGRDPAWRDPAWRGPQVTPHPAEARDSAVPDPPRRVILRSPTRRGA